MQNNIMYMLFTRKSLYRMSAFGRERIDKTEQMVLYDILVAF